MTYVPGELRSRSREIVYARNWGVTAVTSLLGLGLFASEAIRIRELPVDSLNYAYLATLGVTGLLIFLWIWATQHELDLLFDWLDPERYVPPSSIQETLLIVAIGVVLSAMFLAARSPLTYGSIFFVYSVIQAVAGRYTYAEVAKAIKHSKYRLSRETTTQAEPAAMYSKGVKALEAYFVNRPMFGRCLWVVAGATLGVGLAIGWSVSGRRWLALSAYFVYLTTVVVSEGIIGVWRSRRDATVREVAADLSEYLRTVASHDAGA